MEIYNNKEDRTYESLYSDEEWEVFSNRSQIHFDRLKLEGSCHTSLLYKIKEVQNQMLLIVGKHDVVTCEEQIKTFNKDARNGKYIVFEESGHSPHYEEADRFAETVIHFLNEEKGASINERHPFYISGYVIVMLGHLICQFFL